MSLCVHITIAVLLATLPTTAERAEARDLSYEVEVDPILGPDGTPGATERGHTRHEADEAVAGGRDSLQNVDATDRGQLGDATGALVAMRFIDRDDRVLLFDSPLNNTAAAQVQRIRTARDRATLEHRRATPNPDDDAFLASGDGTHRERRPVTTADAAEGARRAPEASVEGALPSERAMEQRSADGHEGQVAAASPHSSASEGAPGSADASPGTGILDGRGTQRSEAARVAHGRPHVDRGPAATNAEQVDARIRDNADSEDLARSMFRSWVHASNRTSRREGAGRGGVGEGGAPGSGGGRREGGRATTYGPGSGDHPALDTSDSRYQLWFRRSRRRVEDALRYPRARALAMDQGTTIYRVYVRRDGTLAGPPRLVRSSRFDDFDAAALAAIRAALPFPPFPADLAPSLDRIPLRLPIDFSNPMVR